MGGVTKIAITGAAGFVGRACVAEARSRGIEVVAVLRREPPSGFDDPGIGIVLADLGSAEAVEKLQKAFAGVDAVIHAAAHLGGDAQTHARDTVAATDHVMQALRGNEAHLVLVSSIGVYDTNQLAPNDRVTEDSPLINAAAPRDAYSGAKLAQEDMLRAADVPAWILRPGAIYGPGRTWHALMGFWIGPLHVELTSDGPLPMSHIDHCAWALVQAACQAPTGIQVSNVVDDDQPTRRRYGRAHKAAFGWPKVILPLPWRLWDGVAGLLAPLKARLPGLLQRDVLRARIMPLHYSNKAMRDALGGQDRARFEVMLARDAEQSR